VRHDDEQRRAEMARGAEIAARIRAQNAPEHDRRDREHTVRRLCLSNKLRTSDVMNPQNHTLDVVAYVDDIEIVRERMGPAWPSENFVANCTLAVAALKSLEGVPDYAPENEERRRRDQYRAQMGRNIPKW
jgi:hypothetical protein